MRKIFEAIGKVTQEQINTMVHDSCVLFCKHSGCGIPRETCTSLGTCKEHDEYRNAIRIHLMKKKNPKYPKSYVECCDTLYRNSRHDECYEACLQGHPMQTFARLLICRDAYWKLYGEEMGLDKPWEPDWYGGSLYLFYYNPQKDEFVKTHYSLGGSANSAFVFPTAEMRDAYMENFDPDIEKCKLLL